MNPEPEPAAPTEEDLVAWIDAEIPRERLRIAKSADRLAALGDLLTIARSVRASIGTCTVDDLFPIAGDEIERANRTALLRRIAGDDEGSEE